MTLKKVKLVVEDQTDKQYEMIKRMKTKLNEIEEIVERSQAWRSDMED